jgi:PST family polysaccharide transporter
VTKILLSLAIIVVGLAARAALDKILTLRGGPELVAHWAQLSAVIEIVSSVALAGIGSGLAVLVAQTSQPARQSRLLTESLKLGVALAVPAMLAVAALGIAFPRLLAGEGVTRELFVAGTVAGCICVVPGMINSYWLGQQRRDLMLGFSLATSALAVTGAYAIPGEWLLHFLTAMAAVPAIMLALIPRGGGAPPEETVSQQDRHALLRYIPVGLSIGVLSPGSTLAARSIVGDAMSWESAGYLQALWRVSDWVAAIAGGFLSVYFLPRLSAAWPGPGFNAELRRSALATVLPSALALLLLGAAHREVFPLLYDEQFRLSDATVALFFGGTLVRIAAWVPMFALFAMRRTLAIAVGEFLSLPLFALLLALLAEGLTLERAGAMWIASYAAFGAFNFWAAFRRRASA